MSDSPGLLSLGLAGRYTLERELGRGGTAIVHLARDNAHDRLVAIKVLRSELAPLMSADRFLREIRVTARLNHPNIVPVLDSGEADGTLYCVLPYMEGGSLRDRLKREKQLPLAEVIAIGRTICAALEAAHAQNLIHRDVKPENILFSGGQACLADFGIARALERATEESTTSTGIVRGTPAYMSPEQASGEQEYDGRSDIYSLACVLYEAIAGVAAFVGATSQAVVAQRLVHTPRPLHVYRPTVPSELEEVLGRALAVAPADRYQTAREFGEALARVPTTLTTQPTGEVARRSAIRRRLTAIGLLGFAVAAVWIVGSQIRGARRADSTTSVSLDTTRYVFLPFDDDSSSTVSTATMQLLEDAFARWRGVNVVDPFQVHDELERHGGIVATNKDAQAVARALGAGRYVRGRASRIGDSLRIFAALYSTEDNRTLYQAAQQMAAKASATSSLARMLADTLLLRGSGPRDTGDARGGSNSLPAVQAFARGDEAIRSWDLQRADSAFALATQFDSDYSRAQLWLAQVRAWNGEASARWAFAAQRAASGRNQLSPRDQTLAEALLALNAGDRVRACTLWASLTRRFPSDFAVWYGLANCLRRDSIVVRDNSSLSGWRFRSSYHTALLAYQRAFELLPSIHRSFRDNSYQSIRALLRTSVSMRLGRALPPDSSTFLAYPGLRDDSLVFTPYPAEDVRSAQLRTMPTTLNAAITRQRNMFRDVAIRWAAAYPRSADAMLAVAVSLELLGNPASLDTVRRARLLASTPDERLRTSAAEVWLTIKFKLADGPAVSSAIALADSLLRAMPPGHSPNALSLAGLAALTGRAQLAAQYAREPRVIDEWKTPESLVEIAPVLRVYAAFGGPVDSLRILESEFQSISRRSLSTQAQQSAHLQWLLRAASLAFPTYRFSSLTSLAGTHYPVLDAQVAWVARDTLAARRIMSARTEVLKNVPPEDRTLDVLLPEAELMASMGDRPAAISRLRPTLDALPATPPMAFAEPDQAAVLVRAMIVLAELSRGQGDLPTARAWARPATELWSHADDFLQPSVRRARNVLH